MIDATVVAPIAIGAVLLIAGATLSRYGVALMGALLGAGGGYLAAPTVGSVVGAEGVAASAAGIAAGIVIGVIAAHMLLSIAVAAVAFGVGTFAGLTVLAPLLIDGAWYVEWGAAVGIGVAVAVAGMLATHTTMIVLTSVVGAALASRSLTLQQFENAQATTSVEPLLFDAGDPVFLGLIAVGILIQFGLLKLGYVGRLITRLPGAAMGRGRGEKGAGG